MFIILMFALITNIILSIHKTWRQKSQFLYIKAKCRRRKDEQGGSVRIKMKYKPSFRSLCSSLHFHTGASHDRKQRRRHQGMFFRLLETLTPASPQQIGMAHSQMRFLLAAWGEKKRSAITTILHDSQSYHISARLPSL